LRCLGAAPLYPLVNKFRVHICAAPVEDFKAWAFSLSVSNYKQSRLASPARSLTLHVSLFSDTDRDTHTLSFKVWPSFGFPPSQLKPRTKPRPVPTLVPAQIRMSTPILLAVTQFSLWDFCSNGSRSNSIHGYTAAW